MSAIEASIASMPTGRAAALMLATQEGWTYTMVAERLGCTRDVVLADLRAGLTDLHRALAIT